MAGCLPLLVQLPLLWALYQLFLNAIELRHAPFILWITDLSAKDPLYVTPILMTATMWLQQRLAPQAGDPQQQRLMRMMPLIFGIMFLQFPSGLVLYWLANNVITIIQQEITLHIVGERKIGGGGARQGRTGRNEETQELSRRHSRRSAECRVHRARGADGGAPLRRGRDGVGTRRWRSRRRSTRSRSSGSFCRRPFAPANSRSRPGSRPRRGSRGRTGRRRHGAADGFRRPRSRRFPVSLQPRPEPTPVRPPPGPPRLVTASRNAAHTSSRTRPRRLRMRRCGAARR